MKNFKHLFFFAIAFSFVSINANAQAYNMGDYWLLDGVEMSEADQEALTDAMSQINPDLFGITSNVDGETTNYGNLTMDQIILAEERNGNDASRRGNVIFHEKAVKNVISSRLVVWENEHVEPAIVKNINNLLSKYQQDRR